MPSSPPSPDAPQSEAELAGLCVALGADRVAGFAEEERALAAHAGSDAQRGGAYRADRIAAIRRTICDGGDPLGNWFCALRSPVRRRGRGATYTPPAIVDAMVSWARSAGNPVRIIDPGTGSGRFLLSAGRAFPRARLLGIEIDPLAALMARANLAAAGLQSRAEIRVADYRTMPLEIAPGPSLFIGNPPYVRHHDIDQRGKQWLRERADRRGLTASQLAGLHVHFFLATLDHARPGDLGAFITASEWLDVNYGRLVRDLLSGPLGLVRLDIIDPRSELFADAQATGAIACFSVGSAHHRVRVRKVDRADHIEPLAGGEPIPRSRLAESPRWSGGCRPRVRAAGMVELGELCRVHRGQVTGANSVWISHAETPALPSRLLQPAVTRARELLASGEALQSVDQLRRVIDLPSDLDRLPAPARQQVEAFLRWAQRAGADRSYIARHRKPWWSVNLREPAPILATYMARRPPAFVRNLAAARHINIAHGIYPREPLGSAALDALTRHLRESASTEQGRTYAGGLTKFEPREMERLLVPLPAVSD